MAGSGELFFTFGREGIRKILDAPQGRNPWIFVIYILSKGNTEETEYTRRAIMIFAASYL